MTERNEKMTVNIDDLEYDDYSDSVFVETRYNGKLFTGTAVDTDKNGTYTEWNFVDGYGEGRCFSRYANGQLQEELILKHGELLLENSSLAT